MTRALFVTQAAFVVTLGSVVGLAGQPQYVRVPFSASRPTVWRINSPLTPDRDLSSDVRIALGQSPVRKAVVGYGGGESGGVARDASLPSDLQAMMSNITENQAPQPLVDNQAAIIGRARTILNTPVPYARVVLRNINTGQIEAEATADQDGRFSFLHLRAAGYVIEMMSTDGRVVATSQAVAAAVGQAQAATVRVASTSTVKALFNNVTTPTVQDTLRTAAQTSVPTVTAQTSSVSPRT